MSVEANLKWSCHPNSGQKPLVLRPSKDDRGPGREGAAFGVQQPRDAVVLTAVTPPETSGRIES
jgi:hypothetical protein